MIRAASNPLYALIDFEGDSLSILGGITDSGVRGSSKKGMRKWTLSRQAAKRWIYDCHVFLPNAAGMPEAKKAFGF